MFINNVQYILQKLNFAWQFQYFFLFLRIFIWLKIKIPFNLAAHFQVTSQAVHLDCVGNIILVDFQ